MVQKEKANKIKKEKPNKDLTKLKKAADIDKEINSLSTKMINKIIQDRAIKKTSGLPKEEKKKIIKSIAKDRKSLLEESGEKNIAKAEKKIADQVIQRYKNIKQTVEGITSDHNKNKDTETEITGFKNFRRVRVSRKNINTKSELYEKLTEFYNQNVDTNHFSLMAKSKINNKYRFISIKPNDLLEEADFISFLDKMAAGEIRGSDALSPDEYELVLNVFDAILEAPLRGKASKHNNNSIYKYEDMGEYVDGLCGYVCLKKLLDISKCKIKSSYFFGKKVENTKKYKGIDEYITDLNYIKYNLSEITIFKNICEDLKINLISNCQAITDFNALKTFSENKNNIIEIKHNNKNLKCIPLKNEYLELFKYNDTPEAIGNIIFDEKEQHYNTISNFDIKDVYISMNRDIFKKVADKYIYLGNKTSNNKDSLKYKLTTSGEIKREYIFFDYEVVFDFNKDNINVPYSLSVLKLTDEDMDLLNKADHKEDKEEIDKIIKDCSKTFNGFNCTDQFYKWFCDIKDKSKKIFSFISFNGVNFDNFILYNELVRIDSEMVGAPFFQNTGLFNFKIGGVHDMFDLKKHLGSSLKRCCESFKVKSCSKKEFDHVEAQNAYIDNKFLEYLETKKEEIETYNVYDVLSLAVLYKRYNSTITDLKLNKYALELHKYKTTGSLIMSVLGDYWKDNNIEMFNYTSQNKEKQKKYIKFYNDLLKIRVGGRVQLFNGYQLIEELMASLDVCSLYPYVMIVLNCYYPCGLPTETKKYIKDKIGFYYCDVDQKYLREKNLPNIIPEKTKEGNKWDTTNKLNNILISSVKIELLKKHGGDKCVTVREGFYFENHKKSYEMFNPLLEFMKSKNEQDKLKEEKDNKYNEVLREVLKLFLNCPSGKLNEGLHEDKTKEINMCEYEELKKKEKKKEIKNLKVLSDSRNDRILVTYENNADLIMNQAHPIHVGTLIYDYSQRHMYEHMYTKIDYKDLVYTDTDSNKIRYSIFNKWVSEYGSKIKVPHWEELENEDPRYKSHKLYEPNTKVFGSFDDEYAKKNLNLHYYLAKKQYLSICKENNKNIKYSFKGIRETDILLDNDFDVKKTNQELHKIYTTSQPIKSDMIKLFNKLYQDKKDNNNIKTKILTFSIRKERNETICVKANYTIKEIGI